MDKTTAKKCTVSVRLTPEQRQQCDKLAIDWEITTSEVIRVILDYVLRDLPRNTPEPKG